MNQIKNTVTITLKESGSIAELKKDFKIYKKSVNNILLDILVPESIVANTLFNQYIEDTGRFATKQGIYTACEVGEIYTKENGQRGKTQSYYLRFIRRVETPDKAFFLYERVLPNELIMNAGTGLLAGELIVNIVNVFNDHDGIQKPTLLSRITSQKCYLEVEESESLDNDEEIEEISELELLSAEVNTLLDEIQNKSDRPETFLKCSILNPLPEDITYNKHGLKTRGILFLDETYNIKTKILEAAQPQKGAVFVSDFSTKDDYLIQTEVFIYQDGFVERTITLNSDSAEVISIGEWQTKVDSFQGKEHFGRFLYIDKDGYVNLTDASKNFIVKNNGIQISDDTSTFNFSDNFYVTAEDKERLNIDISKKFKQKIDEDKESAINEHDTSELAHEFLRLLIEKLQEQKADTTYVNDGLDKKQDKGDYVTYTDVDTKIREAINKIIDNAPVEYDTFKELAEYIASDITGTAKILADIALNSSKIENLENVKANKDELGSTAFSNNYNDLNNLPHIPDGVKLYDMPGVNEDGAMTQKSATDTFETKSNASTIYETKKNATSIYETKSNASATYETITNVDSKIKKAITDIINNAPVEYDTFKELADYISRNESAATAMLADINNLKSGKVDKNQGVSNINKNLKIDSDGNVAPGEFKTYIEIDENSEKWFVIEIEEESE